MFYFATLGLLLPYWGLYLVALGFPPARIGELMAIPQATKLVAPNVWGWLADRSGQRVRIVRRACLISAATFGGIYFAGDSYIKLALVMLLFSFFWNAALPQFEAVTLNHLGNHTHHYSKVRLWGSMGFIGAAVGGGFLVNALGIHILPALMWGMLIALWLSSLIVSEQPSTITRHETPSLGQVLRQPAVLAFFTACFLNQASHGSYYGFFSLYLETMDYSSEFIGTLWGLGVAAEVGLFLLMHRLLPCFGSRQLLLTALALTTLRWILIGYLADNLPLLLFAQTLHAFSFGVFHAVAIHLIHQFFTGTLQGRGQALYSSLTFGAGNALGSLAAGYLWEGLGPAAMYTLAAVLSALGWYVAWHWLHPKTAA